MRGGGKGSLFKKRELFVKINPMEEKKSVLDRRICLTPSSIQPLQCPLKYRCRISKGRQRCLCAFYLSSTGEAERVRGGRRKRHQAT